MNNFLSALGLAPPAVDLSDGVEFWHGAERSGWLMKQGDVIKTWRRRWFVLKQGKLFWFLSDKVAATSAARGVVDVGKCLSVKGAEDVINKAHGFELSTSAETKYFIADSSKEKEEWINSIGRAIVRHSNSLQDEELYNY
mmetsp:Transcript_32060/g.79261  ORF Transcript_32060/g.79261 Transcript_32060/m.79261 type:complete len:140 (-) Transcript_32060:189-608(-)